MVPNNVCSYCRFTSICKGKGLTNCYTLLNIEDLDKLTEKDKKLNNMSFDSLFIKTIYCGMKTETRRVIKENSIKLHINDILYISEDWNYIKNYNDIQLLFKSNLTPSSIHLWKKAKLLPQQFSRFRIKITNLEYQYIQNITTKDLWNEGFNFPEYYTEEKMMENFIKTWDNLYIDEKYKFKNNPQVIKYNFKLLQPDEID